jgi:hypothetical protein
VDDGVGQYAQVRAAPVDAPQEHAAGDLVASKVDQGSPIDCLVRHDDIDDIGGQGEEFAEIPVAPTVILRVPPARPGR